MTTYRRVRKAVLPAAGLGTRFLPATKAQPKEMLPVVDKPLIQYAVEECVASGIEHVIIVTGRGKNAIEDHFDSSPSLIRFLEDKGQPKMAQMVREIGDMVEVSYTRQKEPLGLGHAVLVTENLVGGEPFAVLLGDVIAPDPRPATRQLIDVYNATGKSAIAVENIPRDQTHLYGVVDAKPANLSPWGEKVLNVSRPGRETQAGGGSIHSCRHRPLCSDAGNIRLPASHQARTRRRNPTHRWIRFLHKNKA